MTKVRTKQGAQIIRAASHSSDILFYFLQSGVDSSLSSRPNNFPITPFECGAKLFRHLLQTLWNFDRDVWLNFPCMRHSTHPLKRVISSRAAGIVAALQPRCEEVEREWGNEEEMEGKWGNWEEMEREWGNVILFPFPHSLSISSFSVDFLILFPFPHSLSISSFSVHFLILFLFPHSLFLSSFSLHFLILSPFPLNFLILSPFSRSPAARLQQLVQPC